MSQFRFARLFMMLAAVGLNVLPSAANAQASKSAMPAATSSGPTPAQGAAVATPPADAVRPELFKLLDPTAIKPLMDAKNYTEVQSRITQAEAVANKNPYEMYVTNRMKLSLGSATSNDQMAMAALEAIIASDRLKGAEQAEFIQALANYYYNGKNYPKAIEWFKRYQKDSPTPDKVRPAMIRSYYLSNDFNTTKTELLPIIAASDASGTAPSQEDLRLLASAAIKLKDDATYLLALEKLATYYPTDEIRADLLNRGVARKPGFDAQTNMINVYRMEATMVKSMSADEYVDLAELALQAGFPTEAKKAMDAGYAANVLGTGANAAKHKALRDKATRGAADDAKNIAAGEASATKAKTGAGLVNLGWAYATMDQYDKGIGFIEQGIAKGSLKAPEEAKLRLGMAQARGGKKAEAIATFKSIKGGGGAGDLAKYWVMLLNAPAPAAATAAN
ncbi:tetratricopeptide repeat protein [Massilia sp. S19_KUP03_FR1]|uniref:tetratricopeptide repeat protein n=1 Tax=Massilia sp. S19_KUP03_FR1 TaxID=3025503 RepID=UPI002FCD5659